MPYLEPHCRCLMIAQSLPDAGRSSENERRGYLNAKLNNVEILEPEELQNKLDYQ